MSKSLSLVLNSGRHARYDTPLSVDLGSALVGVTQAKLTEPDTGRAIPCQIDGTKLVFIFPGIGERTERRLALDVVVFILFAPAARTSEHNEDQAFLLKGILAWLSSRDCITRKSRFPGALKRRAALSIAAYWACPKLRSRRR